LFVKFNTVPVQQLAVLFLKSVGAMVLFLPLRVLQHSFQLALAHRKDSIPALAEKAAVASFEGLDPFSRMVSLSARLTRPGREFAAAL